MVNKVELDKKLSKVEKSVDVQYYDDDYINRPRPKKDKYSILSAQLNLPTPQRKGFVRQWVIDREQRIFNARDWMPVKGEDGLPMRAVMNHRTKEPEFGTYMEIPEKFYQENIQDDDAIRKDLVERRINNKDIVHEVAEGSENGSGKVDSSKFYTPDAFTNKIETNN